MLMSLPTEALPILYALDSKGRVKVWRAWAYEDIDKTAGFKILHGLKDGKLQEQGKTIKVGKNIGRANETTPFAQAIAEITSKWTKKHDQDGYAETEEGLSVPKLPMLAKNYRDASHKIIFPAYLQPKLNGVRCFAKKVSDTEIRYTSRKGKIYTTLEHITPTLLTIMEVGEIFDGEVYNHRLHFQDIVSGVKKQNELSTQLEFWVYDVADANMDFIDRFDRMDSTLAFMPYNSPVRILNGYDIVDEDDVFTFHSTLVQDGFEGVIIRNLKGGYSFKHRSSNLQKYKEFFDEEFLIVGGKEGDGTSFAGMVIFKCLLPNGETFDCVPKGSHAYKRELWNKLDEIVAAKTMLTVRYQELSKDGEPIFPVGIAFRSGIFNDKGEFEPDI